MIAMGVMDAPAKTPERESPEIPADMMPLYAHYRALRFGRCVSDDLVTLIPRDALTYAEIDAYSKLVDWQPTVEDVSVLMDIDAIFESRDLKGGK